MPQFTKLTPNLVVASVERSLAFYALHDRLKPSVKIVMPLVTQFYGMREFAIEDPDGYVITFAGRVNG
jgi:uncharacterized glyoxalase superfamily protein PhnB